MQTSIFPEIWLLLSLWKILSDVFFLLKAWRWKKEMEKLENFFSSLTKFTSKQNFFIPDKFHELHRFMWRGKLFLTFDFLYNISNSNLRSSRVINKVYPAFAFAL